MRAALLAALAALSLTGSVRAEDPAPTPRPKAEAAAAALPAFPDPSTWTLEQVLEANLHARIAKARACAAAGDVLGWLAAVMPDSFPLAFCDMHRWQVAQRHVPWTALEAPRGHSKTTVGLIGIPLYQSLVEPDTYRHYLIIQSNGTKADAVNIAIKLEIEENQVIRAIYGDQRGAVVWNNSQFVLRNGVCFTAVGAGTSIRGIQYRTVRPDWINLDDLYDEDDIYNPEAARKKTEWFWSTLFPARNKTRPLSKFNVQGTAINEQDALYRLEKDPNFTFKRFTATNEDGTPLWPELNSAIDLARERASMGDASYEREMEMKRGSDKESIIKRAWLASWRRPASDFRCDNAADPYSLLDVRVCIDPSLGKKQQGAGPAKKAGTGDPAGFVRIWKLQPRNLPGALPVYFIDSLLMERLGLQERINTAKEFVTTSRPDRRVRRLTAEGIAGFDDFATLLKAAVGVPVDSVDHVADKMLNLERHQVYFQNGRVFINQEIDRLTLEQIEYQLTTNKPTHDDGRDAIFLGLDDGGPSMASWVKAAPRVRA
ncbi:MAG: hypothetical protein V4510_09625 [bacterium]